MISGALLIASLAAMADNFDCAALSVGGRIFNVKPLDGSLAALDAGSIEHPPSRDSYTLKLSICAALAVSAELPAQDNCEKGAWACLIVTNHKGTPDAPRVTSALQISTVAPTLASDSNSNLSLSFGQGNKTAVITLSCKSKTLVFYC